MSEPVVVVGGDAAGMSAASKFKREAPDRDVIVFERGQWVSYGACGLPYYVKGEIESLSELVSVTPEEFVQERDVQLRTNQEVTAIDREAKTVSVDGLDGTSEQAYSDLLIATGAHAIEPPLEGMDLGGVFTLHSMRSAAEIRRYLGVETPDIAVEDDEDSGVEPAGDVEAVGIIGGGYVGIEMAEALAAHDLDVHVFEMLPHTLGPFGPEAAGVVEDHLREEGVQLHLDTPVEGLVGDDRVTAIATGDLAVPVDMAVVGVGVAPNAELAEAAGIETGATGAIATDEYGRTNDEHVYAAGDCAEMTHVVTGEPDHVPLALSANRAGRAIGQTLAGSPTPVGEIAGTATVKAFELEVARTGLLDEGRAREAGFDPASVTITTESRAHYYPGGAEIQLTMTGDRDSGRLLGASLVGREGVPKRVDTVAAALHNEATVEELVNYDLAYAPPFSPVWDPVLTTAKVLRGQLSE